MQVKRWIKALVDKIWWSAAFRRAVKTAAQVLLGSGTIGLAGDVLQIWYIDWRGAMGIAIGALLWSLITSLAGLPEVTLREEIDTKIGGTDD